ncbi:hypothetical protein [Streptomyces sp. A1136]|uniref:hypothetical protein n=1 Tax=Streptomyces sp. A1136 TaxID=2563102 RepID=UPI001F0F4D1B|nr:hypothetical protein [Streptomyces sp. A1136]
MTDVELESLARMWDEHMKVPFPRAAYWSVVEGEDMVLLDTETAGCVISTLEGRLDDRLYRILLGCLAALDKVLPFIDDEEAVRYYRHLRDTAAFVAGTHPAGAA